jgi:uncharacterized protein (DUF342 family)
LDQNAISLMRVYVHEGDVNLRTGNIRFDGPVEIKGCIDAGAVVETTGDLIIHGEVRNASVRSRGSITIKAGVTTGETGSIQARGDISAEFIENSTIVCGGNLTVTKALLNSRVFCGGAIKLTGNGGVAAGGQLSCCDGIQVFNLGFRNGSITVLDVGADWRASRSLDIKKRRLDKLQKKTQDDRQTLRELVQKKAAQVTPRHAKMKEELQERLTRLRGFCERLEAQIAKAATQISYNQEARVLVKDTLVSNVHLTVAGQFIQVANDVAGVAVLAKRRRGSYFIPLEDVEKEMKEAGGGDAAPKKAS